MVHPVTINSLVPERFAALLFHKSANVQSTFLYALVDDLYEQVVGDKKRGYNILANDMFNVLPHLIDAAKSISKTTSDDMFKSSIVSDAKVVGALRYDVMISFFDSYSFLTSNTSLHDAAFCVREAWCHTPVSWKKEFASDSFYKK